MNQTRSLSEFTLCPKLPDFTLCIPNSMIKTWIRNRILERVGINDGTVRPKLLHMRVTCRQPARVAFSNWAGPLLNK